jgi:hypothetical protein
MQAIFVSEAVTSRTQQYLQVVTHGCVLLFCLHASQRIKLQLANESPAK